MAFNILNSIVLVVLKQKKYGLKLSSRIEWVWEYRSKEWLYHKSAISCIDRQILLQKSRSKSVFYLYPSFSTAENPSYAALTLLLFMITALNLLPNKLYFVGFPRPLLHNTPLTTMRKRD